jgi:hypothetical protein
MARKAGRRGLFALRGAVVATVALSFAVYRAASSRVEHELNEVHNQVFREAVTISAYVTFFAVLTAACWIKLVVAFLAKCSCACILELCKFEDCKRAKCMGWIWWVQAFALAVTNPVMLFLATFVVPPDLVDYVVTTWVGLEIITLLVSGIRAAVMRPSYNSGYASVQDERDNSVNNSSCCKCESPSWLKSEVSQLFLGPSLAVYGAVGVVAVALSATDGPNYLFSTYLVDRGDATSPARRATDVTVVVLCSAFQAAMYQITLQTNPTDCPRSGETVTRTLSGVTVAWAVIWVVLGILEKIAELDIGNWEMP